MSYFRKIRCFGCGSDICYSSNRNRHTVADHTKYRKFETLSVTDIRYDVFSDSGKDVISIRYEVRNSYLRTTSYHRR